MEGDAPPEPPEVRVQIGARQQPPTHVALPPPGEGREPPSAQPAHEPVEAAEWKLSQRGEVDRFGMGRNRRDRGVGGGSHANRHQFDAQARGAAPQVRFERCRRKSLVHQVRQAGERRHLPEAAQLVGRVAGEGDVTQVRHAAHPLAQVVHRERESLRLGTQHERRHDRLPRHLAEYLSRYHRAGRQHEIDLRIRQQRIDCAPCPGDRPVGDPPLLGGKDHREPRADESGDLLFESEPHLVVAFPWTVERDADDAGVACHLRGCRPGARSQRAGREQPHYASARVKSSHRSSRREASPPVGSGSWFR